eukprot:GEMP01008543.1.p1 GENE.GEMP01008543.1~~GEMP01008543.1.p1  ORF type:complete len:812 (+),score=192.82 GEMP01008543.1:165-2600(+)
MGFLEEHTPLQWEDALGKLKYVRDHGIEQFIHMFHQVKHIRGDLLRWGDELEYAVLKLDGDPTDPNRKVKISLRCKEIMHDLKELEVHGRLYGLSEADMCNWIPEYGRWMVEATPRKPFEGITALLRVEDHMRLRRSRLMSVLVEGEIVPTMASFPMLGVGSPADYIWDPHTDAQDMKTRGPIANSLFVPDEVINLHPRFRTLTKNIRMRRQENVVITSSKFKDTNTAKASPPPRQGERANQQIPETVKQADELDHVYADAMAFGMGCCCLQVTFQAANIGESRHLYDQLATFTPIMLALTAASPYLRGWLTEEDVRWNIVAQSVDDRTQAERGETGANLTNRDPRKAGDGVNYLRKSRFGGIGCYLCNCKSGEDPASRSAWNNDVAVETDKSHEERLIRSGVDEVLTKHVAGLFARDPLVIFDERVELDDRVFTDHFENLQSTNWQSVRWKPPHPERGTLDITSEEHIGWRVEFRTMEIQITDFENAAFTVFIVLMSRVLGALKLNTYIPISKLDDNMRVACKRNAVLNERFWIRKDVFPASVNPSDCFHGLRSRADSLDRIDTGGDEGFLRLTIAEVLLGTCNLQKERCGSASDIVNEQRCANDPENNDPAASKSRGPSFVGFIPLINTYLEFVGTDSVNRTRINTYLNFIVGRATGKIKTGAQWIRDFIREHPSYKKDSRVPPDTAYDLAVAIKEIGEGIREAKDLIGDVTIPVCTKAANPLKDTAKDCLVRKYMRVAQVNEVDYLDKEVAEKQVQAKIIMDELRDLEERQHEGRTKMQAAESTSPSVKPTTLVDDLPNGVPSRHAGT